MHVVWVGSHFAPKKNAELQRPLPRRLLVDPTSTPLFWNVFDLAVTVLYVAAPVGMVWSAVLVRTSAAGGDARSLP